MHLGIPAGRHSGCVIVPFGHQWVIQHQTELLTPKQLQERMNAIAPGCYVIFSMPDAIHATATSAKAG